MKALVLVGLWINLALSCFGQELEFSFDFIGSKEGLTAAYNDFIYKDSRNFVWISSIEGLYRYDGLELVEYPHGSNSETGINGEYIQSRLFEDSNGNLWFSTYEWINCYIREKDEFESFQLLDENNEVIFNEYSIFHFEKDSVLWLRANGQIYKYNIHTFAQEKLIETIGTRFAVDTTNEGTVKRVYSCPWEISSGFEVVNLTGVEALKKRTYWRNGLPESTIKQIEISESIVIDNDKVLFFSDMGLVRFNPKSGKHQIVNLPNSGERIVDGVSIDRNHMLLVAPHSGIWLYDPWKNKIIKNLKSKKVRNNNYTEVREIYMDNQNHVWISSNSTGQIEHSWIYSNSFDNPFIEFDNAQQNVISIVEDENSRIWCSTKEYGVYVFDNEGNLLRHWPIDLFANNFNPIHQLSLNADGNIWGIDNRYIYQLNLALHRPNVLMDADSIKLYDLEHISKKDKIVLTDRGGFLLSHNSSNLEIGERIIESESSQSFQIFKGRDSIFYFPKGTYELLIYELDKDGSFSNEQIEIHFNIYSVWEDEIQRFLWLGTSEGLFKIDLNSANKRLEKIETEILKDEQILSITNDINGRLWLTSNDGLFRYNPEKDQTVHFKQENGLSSNKIFTLCQYMCAKWKSLDWQ